MATNLGQPQDIAADSSDNVFFVDNLLNYAAEVPAGSFGCSSASCLNYVAFGLNSAHGIAVDGSDDVFIGDYGNNEAWKAHLNSFDFGSIGVGSTSPKVTAYFNFESSATLNATPYQVLTQGAMGLDFADAGASGCAAASYVAGNICSVNVDLTPKSAGLITGAVALTDNSNNRIATAYISGTGSGPQVTFFTNSEDFQGLGGGLIWGRGLAVDRKGNIFVADSSNDSADEFLATSGYSQSILSTSFSGPLDVAVDGAGNVFVADTGDSKVKELLAPAYTTINLLGSGFNGPSGLTIDGTGNVFVADTGNHAVKEIVAPAYTVVETLNSASFTAPSAVAIDASGNLFVADSSLGTVSELTAASGYLTVTSPITGLVQPIGLALDASGNVYVADTGDNEFDEFLAASSYAKSTLSAGFTAPSGIALDAAGNVYGTIPGTTQFGELELSTAPTLSFNPVSGGTIISPQTVTVSNIGNSDLTFPVAAAFDATTLSNGSFTFDVSSTCTTSPLTLGTNCTDAIDFSPSAAQTYTGTFTLTDNNLNMPSPYATQAINLTGTGGALATMIGPAPGSILTSASTTFTWNAGPAGTTGYGLNVGTTPGGTDLVNIGPLAGTSVTVNLPTNGATIYVRLWTEFAGPTYFYNDYTYTEFTQLASAISSPAPSSTLTSASTTFTWNAGPVGTTGYGLNVGTTPGGTDLVNIGPLSGTSVTVSLPTNGATIYVRLWTEFAGPIYIYNDYTYTEFTRLASAISSPAPGGTLTSASTTFTWNTGPAGTTGYGLNVGTTPGGTDLVNIGPLSGTSVTVSLPTNGATIYVRLWTEFAGPIYIYNDYTYTEFTQLASAISSPAPGGTLTSASTTFTWNAGPAGTTGYGLNVGTTPGGTDLVNIGPLAGTSVTVNLPTNGATIYVRLWTEFPGPIYIYNDYTYTEFTQLASAISSPAPGSTLTSASTTFTWNAGPVGTTGYGLNVGTTPGGTDLVNIGPLAGTSVTVNLPTNGATIYVRLWTEFAGPTYLYNDYTYAEFTQ